MDFLKKAKQQMHELQDEFGDKLKLGQSSQTPAPASQASGVSDAATSSGQTPSSYAGTPAASTAQAGGTSAGASDVNLSVAPCTLPGAPAKIPLAARKSIRDDYESKHEELNARLSKILGMPWTCYIDQVHLYSYALEERSQARDNPGKMVFNYFESSLHHIENFVSKYGDDGRAQLNRLAFSHTMTIEPAEEGEITSSSGCDVSGGKLRILFKKQNLGYNQDQALEKLGDAVNQAGAASEAAAGSSTGAGPGLNLAAKQSIRTKYDPAIGPELAKARKLLACPTLEFVPNFEANFAKLKTSYAALSASDFQRQRSGWDASFGGATLNYFQGFVSKVEGGKFENDDMLQEGFQEAVEKNEVHLRVVDKLEKKTYNEAVIEGGILYMQTTPQYWWSNVDDACGNLIDLL